MRFTNFFIFFLLTGLCFAGEKSPAEATAFEVISQLGQGGYVIYFRHGKTAKQGEKSVDEKLMHRCEIQRNLSAEGKSEMRKVGLAIKKIGVPIGTVLTSPYCRCVDTAKLVAGRAEISSSLFFAIHVNPVRRKLVTGELKKMLSTVPAKGSNTVLVSHTANLKEAAGIWPKPEGVAYVFKPSDNGTYREIGRILPSDWLAYADSSKTLRQ